MILTPPHTLDGPRWAGRRVGLLGGSFSPPHEGHVHISQLALRMLRLDAVWWLVTPRNPLKTTIAPLPYEDRLAQCRALIDDPRLLVSDLERQLGGLTRTLDTLRAIKPLFPQTEFVLLTGMDNALTFHLWHGWRDILAEVATAHIARPPADALVRSCPLRECENQVHTVLNRPGIESLEPGRSYWILDQKLSAASSTAIRNKQF